MLNNIWVLEYSIPQGCFHRETLGAMLQSNRDCIARGFQPQYVPIAFARSPEECFKLSEEWRRLGFAHHGIVPVLSEEV